MLLSPGAWNLLPDALAAHDPIRFDTASSPIQTWFRSRVLLREALEQVGASTDLAVSVCEAVDVAFGA